MSKRLLMFKFAKGMYERKTGEERQSYGLAVCLPKYQQFEVPIRRSIDRESDIGSRNVVLAIETAKSLSSHPQHLKRVFSLGHRQRQLEMVRCMLTSGERAAFVSLYPHGVSGLA